MMRELLLYCRSLISNIAKKRSEWLSVSRRAALVPGESVKESHKTSLSSVQVEAKNRRTLQRHQQAQHLDKTAESL